MDPGSRSTLTVIVYCIPYFTAMQVTFTVVLVEAMHIDKWTPQTCMYSSICATELSLHKHVLITSPQNSTVCYIICKTIIDIFFKNSLSANVV